MTVSIPERKTIEERKAILAQSLAQAIAAGARVESQSDFFAVIVTGKRVNHLLHFFVGLFTVGLWWVVWIFLAITGGERRAMIQVDEYGNVLRQKA
jgi:hypothetical protein